MEKRPITIPALCLLLWTAAVLPAMADTERIEGIEVRGSPVFIARTKAALTLLIPTSHLDVIKKYLVEIHEGERTETAVQTSVCSLTVDTVMRPAAELAAAIGHESYHSKLYHDSADEWAQRLSKNDGTPSLNEEKDSLRKEFEPLGDLETSQQKLHEEMRHIREGASDDERESTDVRQKLKDIDGRQSELDKLKDDPDAKDQATGEWRALEIERRRLKVGLIAKERKVPENPWEGIKGERQCLIFERRILRDLGADQKAIDWVSKNIESPTYQGDPHSIEDAKRRWW